MSTDQSPDFGPTYPAIASCVGDARPPSLGEIRKVAKRIRQETFPGCPLSRSMRRAVTRAAMATLGVGGYPT